VRVCLDLCIRASVYRGTSLVRNRRLRAEASGCGFARRLRAEASGCGFAWLCAFERNRSLNPNPQVLSASMSLGPVTLALTAQRDYDFAAKLVGVQCPLGEQDARILTPAGNVLSDAAYALLSQVKSQQQSQAMRPETASMRRDALVLISFVHTETMADARCVGSFAAEREAHIWMVAVLLYDKFQNQSDSYTAWIKLDPFRQSQNPRLTPFQRKARLDPTSPHYWMLSVPAQDHFAAERYCHDMFVLVCYSIAFKWENSESSLLFKNLEKSLVRFSLQSGKQTFDIRPGALDTAELIFLGVVKWDVCVEGPLVHIDNLLWNAGVLTKDSVLLHASYEHASLLLLDQKMLSHSQYSPFYAACVCVLQACNDLAIPAASIFGNAQAIALSAVVSGCV
jgi:hypothetical protein